jgi:Na+-driven multidrug efflux pump
MGLGAQELIIILVTLPVLALLFVVPLWALIHIISTPNGTFQAAGRSKGLWILAIIATWLIGAAFIPGLIYLFSTRKTLQSQPAIQTGIGTP